MLAYTWAAPTTAVGLAAGALTLATGGRARICQGAIEFHGGFARWYLCRVAGAGAMAVGHTIFGRDERLLDATRAHEQVHVRQAERWGIAFIPAYLACSAWEWSRRSRGRHYYLDNWFERQARRECGEEG